MRDIAAQLTAIHRAVGTGPVEDGEGVSVLLRRTYDAHIEDVWEAVTDPDRVKRWFLPLTGDLREGGTFQLEGNAGGDIVKCDPPRLLKVTFGGPSSRVELRLSATDDESTVFELEHTVPIEMAGSGAGALFVGPGWDGVLVGLGLFLAGEDGRDAVTGDHARQSIDAWVATVESSGTATPDEIAAGTAAARAQFTG
ncbi:SRPBCC family protein [Actinoplanes sp. NPDC049118]|uniref:SRPBCC family protein n=1 Tax=Actinoplanes sp. NPDC049118 TaxID=3155769 RepID=UPI0033FE55AA